MKRTQIQLDERTYEILRRRAFEKGCSISSYVDNLQGDENHLRRKIHVFVGRDIKKTFSRVFACDALRHTLKPYVPLSLTSFWSSSGLPTPARTRRTVRS